MARKEKTNQMERFVAVRKNKDGSLHQFKSDSCKVYDYEMAVEAVEAGKI